MSIAEEVRPATVSVSGRAPVTRDRILQAAIALADRGGLESLSMRKLAADLQIEAASLYYHVRNKGDLLDGMADVVFGEMGRPSPGEEWKAALAKRAASTREVLVRHPWAIPIIDSRTTPGAATLRYLEDAIAFLREAGFSIAMAAHVLSVLDSYVRGFAMQEVSLPLDPGGSIEAATESILEQQPMMSNAYPHLAEMAGALILQPGYAYGNEFSFGLGLILDGLESARASDRDVSATQRDSDAG
ncbi:TetR/AcrR family transcriptional regulator [Microbacterium sp. LMI12-1-1.1]|uniref:TetR/AcrR family transcriptional regulator n=1 Tax=Microbacterium sp. LMI12-1-1.1 TaxID=3135225 RepID=UPI0034238C1C